MWGINRSLLILKVHYFLYQAGIAPTQTALPVYMQTRGFSGSVVGTVYTVLPLLGLIIKPALGAVADRFKWHRGVMLLSEVAILVCYFSVQFVPPAVGESGALGNSTNTLPDSVVFSQYQVYVFLLLLIVSWGGVAAANTLSDTICIAKSGDWSLYGRQRLWGSIGYGVLSIIIGSIVDAISSGDNKNYTPAFYASLVVLLIDVVVTLFFLDVKIEQKSSNITKDVMNSFWNGRVLLFLVWCTAVGASMGLQWTFLYWTLEQIATASGPDAVSSIKTIEGLVNGVQTFIGEVPAFFFAHWVLSKIGHGRCMSLIFFIIGVRFVCYSLLINPWLVLLIEPLQLTFGLFYSTLTSYASIVAPPGTEATVQSLMCAFVEGIGVAIGSYVGGKLMDSYGGQMTFRIFGITFFALFIINECIEFISKRYTARPREVAAQISEESGGGETRT